MNNDSVNTLLNRFKNNQFYSVQEILDVLYDLNIYICDNTIYRALRDGRLRGIRAGKKRKWFVEGNDVIDYFFTQ